MLKLYQKIALRLQAIKNCEKSGNTEWSDKHRIQLRNLLDMMPSGSGIDDGTKLEEDLCAPNKLVFTFGYHHMNEAGMYDGWTDHALTVTPSFDSINMKISGSNRNDIKEYLYEVYYYALMREVDK